ncbi:MAG: hypothetical protein GY952_08180 [Rhodobacteraceae bacterium]|nr:hypothetical protein [Paracoccaceae bacterium]
MNQNSNRPAVAALGSLIVLQVIMLSALYAKVPPHPPETTPLFGIAPFLGASLAAAFSAIWLGTTDRPAGRVLCLLSALLAAISFGPQKYIDPQFPLIWPAVIAGQVAIVALCVLVARSYRHRNYQAAAHVA